MESLIKATHGHDSRSKKEKDNDSIMSTNNSCIVSKRSVEKIYHGQDHGFLRHFVKKFQRRSPLINRGYWLRMRAVEHTVKRFLSDHHGQDTVIVNLGCGYDTLPFKFLSAEQDLCAHTQFVDVDYHKLMSNKCRVIMEAEALRKHCQNASETLTNSNVLLSSDQYRAVAADLNSDTDLAKLAHLLEPGPMPILLLAEVSMTYMEPEMAARVIRWASAFPRTSFMLLEQYLPDGASNPFAETMLKHFKKLNSPIHPATCYPSLASQRQRFTSAGWPKVKINSLFSLWNQASFINTKERQSLDQIEPFDEWEEFMLFAAHYFLLVATNSEHDRAQQSSIPDAPIPASVALDAPVEATALDCLCTSQPSHQAQRRHGAGYSPSVGEVKHQGGYGPRSRLDNSDTIIEAHEDHDERQPGPDAIVTIHPFRHETTCHTITPTQAGSHLLVGGRLSPDKALSSCYLETRGAWKRVEDLPVGRYRHCSVAWGKGVMIFGGKTDSASLVSDWLYWEYGKGWSKVGFIGDVPPLRFGACAIMLSAAFTQGATDQCSAFLAGGIGADGSVLEDAWQVDLMFAVPGMGPMVRCWKPSFKNMGALQSIYRFGASITRQGDAVFMVGGIGPHGYTPEDRELSSFDKSFTVKECRLNQSGREETLRRPLLVGHQATAVGASTFLIYGGGATCFSFGSCWNNGLLTVSTLPGLAPTQAWHLLTSDTQTSSQQRPRMSKLYPHEGHDDGASTVTPEEIERIYLLDGHEFDRILASQRPRVLEDVNLGDCVSKWTNEYLTHTIGPDVVVTVHSSKTPKMSFLDKNFLYVKKPFGEFMQNISAGGQEYMRAISRTRPTETATSLETDFPQISGDFQLPAALSHVAKHAHSSPLRISGPVNMWLHYDVMSNVLCQIRGQKRVCLYAPWDVSKLQFPAGASSSRLDAWDEEAVSSSSLRSARAFQTELRPGDVLYIPAFWAHTASPSEGTSVAVNVFFRDMEAGYAAGKDVYGNRDVQAYENGRKDVERIVKSFSKLPSQCSRFYLQRLADELADASNACAEGHIEEWQ